VGLFCGGNFYENFAVYTRQQNKQANNCIFFPRKNKGEGQTTPHTPQTTKK
jgi:hypothetical protein